MVVLLTPDQAVQREVREETGFKRTTIKKCLGVQKQNLPENQRMIAVSTRVYTRPDPTSFDWAFFRPGIVVDITRNVPGFTQVVYQEFDNVPEPSYVSMEIRGWVPDDALAGSVERFFFLISSAEPGKDRWTNFADNHTSSLFWSPLDSLPQIIHPQDTWLEYLKLEYPYVIQRNLL